MMNKRAPRRSDEEWHQIIVSCSVVNYYASQH